MNNKTLIDKLALSRSLTHGEYLALIEGFDEELAQYAAAKADEARRAVYGNSVFVRGLIEISSICRNNCLYCGLRRSNAACERYKLTPEQILACCAEGDALGIKTFVLQAGEGSFTCDEICAFVREIKAGYPGNAVTLSLGEFSREEYAAMKQAGADRYLLRHETADREHYRRLHPDMDYDNRMRCLRDLRELGYQVGCGFMVGSPYQTAECIAKDLEFIEQFGPDMCGIGPFIPHKDTPFAGEKAGGTQLTVYLLSLIRLIKPDVLLPATTALGTVDPKGREKGIAAGANVIMPNLSPVAVRDKYSLYDNKICTGEESAQCMKCIETRMKSIGFEISYSRGDIRHGSI